MTALVGDNGAGKSVLIKCIAGIHVPGSGEFFWQGNPVWIRSPRDAAALGIEKGVLFWLGRIVGVREPGLRLIVPVIDVRRRVSLRIVTMPIQLQCIITRDNGASAGVVGLVRHAGQRTYRQLAQ